MTARFRTSAAAFAGVLAFVVSVPVFARAQDAELVDGPGKGEVIESCTQCHSTGLFTAQRRTPDEWSEVLDRMVGFGGMFADDQVKAILGYLNANLGKQSAAGDGPKPPAAAAPPSSAVPVGPHP